jgi:Pyridoxamine 5'-phosphate oxidase
MPDLKTIGERNLAGYDLPMVDWARVQEALKTQMTQAPETGGPNRHTTWLTTINVDGSPHVRPLGATIVDGTWYFKSGPGSGKSRALARDSRCVISVAVKAFDLVIEGTAARVTDPGEVQKVVDSFNEGGWPVRAEGNELTAPFSAPSAGPPPWYAYRVVPQTIYAFATSEPGGAARFDVAAA